VDAGCCNQTCESLTCESLDNRMLRRGIKHFSRVSDVLFRKLRIERDITIFPDDVFLTSYPRSGNTWMRFLVGNLVHPDEPVTFLSIERIVPDMYKSSDRALRKLSRPRILKSHECFDPRYRKVIYIVRDPRDVAVSNYHWEMKVRSVREGYSIEDFVPRWMDSQFWPRIGSWGDHVASWLSTRQGQEGFLLLRYEDLKRDSEGELTRVATLLRIEAARERLTQAVELSSADQMRKLERAESTKWVATTRTRQDKPFVRDAIAGGWKTVLPEKTVACIETRWGHLMQKLGYELATPGLSASLDISDARR
jgi:sulfotransferase family protein